MSQRDPVLARLEYGAFAIGALGLLVGIGALGAGTRPFTASYLVAFLFWNGLSLGCLALSMLHALVGGDWGVQIRRLLQAGTRTMPVMALLFVPVLFGLSSLYPWARSALPHAYLQRPFFLLRVAVYFVAWIGLAFWVPRWADDPRLARRNRMLCGGGLVVYGVTVFFSAVDWILSLEPGWTSTVYGMIVMAGHALSALAWVTALVGALSTAEAWTPARRNDLGNLLLTFVMLWAYVAFSQYLIIWSGDLPRETSWVLNRTRGGWDMVARILIVLHFAVPFLLLLFRRVKRSRVALPIVAGGLVAIQGLDVFWRVRPVLEPGRLSLHLPDLIAPVAVGGIWVGTYLLHLRRRPLLPAGGMPHA